MKNVSLYIAKRYNSNTLIISLVLISLTALLTGTLIYAVNSFSKIFHNLFYSGLNLSFWQNFLIYSLIFIYLIFQFLGIYFLSKKLNKKKSRSKSLIQNIGLGLISGSIGGLLFFLNPGQNPALLIPAVIFIVSGLLFIIFGLLSNLFSKRRITGVNIITSIAVFALTIATTALFIILSVFSGLEKMNTQLFSTVNPDLKISPAKGKLIPNMDKTLKILDENPDIEACAKVIEEKVSVEFDGKQDIAYIKGIEKNYKDVVRVDTAVVYGNYLDFSNPYEIMASDGVARRLQMYIDHQHTSRLRMPKPGKGLIKTEDEAFNTAVADLTGVFILNEQFDKFVFSPLELTQILLQLPEEAAYGVEIRLKPGAVAKTVKADLQSKLGQDLIVETRQDMDATFIKVMNIENLVIYLIFTLVIIIASFNLAGAIIIIILDKKLQIKTMRSFGMRLSKIKDIFFQTGVLITVFSVMIGILQGSFIGWLQNKYHLVMANPFVPFPFEFRLNNYLIVIFTVLIIGGIVSRLVSRRIPV